MVASFVARPFSSIILVTDSDEELYCINTYRGSMSRTVEFNIRHGAFDQIVDHPWQLKGPKGTYEAKKVEEEDDEPASKRTKLSSEELKCLKNGSTIKEPAAGSSRDLMSRPLQSEGGEKIVGSKGLIKKVEFVRIIAKALYSLGYIKSGAHLEEESGISLHSSVVNVFIRQILEGNWDESVATLHNIGLRDEMTIKSASFFFILEHKFFEILDEEKVIDALKTLKTEIAHLCINNSKVRELYLCIMSPSHCFSVWSGKQNTLRARSQTKLLEELQKLFSPAVMIPERRLEHLVE
ncbi:hypothetical protein CRYUN_Cryun19dG0141700 [Craigia yunnanensis]